MEGWENTFRQIKVPDLPACNIADILWPYVGSVQYYDAGVLILPIDGPSVTLATGATKELTYKVLLRNTNEATPDEVTFSVADDAIATVSAGGGTISIEGIAVGTTELVVSRATPAEDGVLAVPSTDVVANLEIVVT